MAITFNFGSGSQGTATTKALKPWQYTVAFRAADQSKGAATMIDTKTDLDKPTQIKVTREKIDDVYKTLTVEPVPTANQALNASGTTVRAELRTMATKTVGTDTIFLPLWADIRVRIPNDAEITGSDVDTLVSAAYAALCDDSGSNIVISDIARGALTPAGV